MFGLHQRALDYAFVHSISSSRTIPGMLSASSSSIRSPRRAACTRFSSEPRSTQTTWGNPERERALCRAFGPPDRHQIEVVCFPCFDYFLQSCFAGGTRSHAPLVRRHFQSCTYCGAGQNAWAEYREHVTLSINGALWQQPIRLFIETEWRERRVRHACRVLPQRICTWVQPESDEHTPFCSKMGWSI